ncbi:MAG: hypothetical protein PVI43_00455 [Candidatus Bathyarchaeota archaeon]|jgi:hypothetical protein
MKLYKLTNKSLQTYNGFQWEIGKTETTSGSDDLCSGGWLHAYSSPLIAVLHNPVHTNIETPRLFECEGGGEFKDDMGMKCGVTELTLIMELSIPNITLEQRIKYAILCALEVNKDKGFTNWAEKWMSGEDRSVAAAEAAEAAARAAEAAARAAAAEARAEAAEAAARAAAATAWAAAATAWAAEAAARAAAAEARAEAAEAAARAAAATAWAAEAAAWAAAAAARATKNSGRNIDLQAIAEKACS